MKYAWIARHKSQWPITLTCEVLGVSTSGYFEHRRRKNSDTPNRPGASRRMGDEALLVHIKAIHAEFKQEYGWPKMWKELQARGISVGKERVRLATRREAMDEVMDWLTFYIHNNRLHSTLGYVSPMTFEQRWFADQQQGRNSA